MTNRYPEARLALAVWPQWVADLRKRKFKVASWAMRQKLGLGTGEYFNPDVAYMYRRRSANLPGEKGHEVVTCYRFTTAKAPERIDKDIWR